MKRWNDLLGIIEKHYETWLYIGFVVLGSHFSVAGKKGNRLGILWETSVAGLAHMLLPVLVFSWYKERWKAKLAPSGAIGCGWVICFGLYLPATHLWPWRFTGSTPQSPATDRYKRRLQFAPGIDIGGHRPVPAARAAMEMDTKAEPGKVHPHQRYAHHRSSSPSWACQYRHRGL